MFESFYHGTIKRITSVVGTLFNNIIISRDDADGNTRNIRVPLIYASKEKWMKAIQKDEEDLVKRSVQIILPNMAFKVIGMEYDSTRMLNPHNKTKATYETTNDQINVQYNYQYIPINIYYDLYLYSRNFEDSLKVIEQILPAFTPDFVISIKNNIWTDKREYRDLQVNFRAINLDEMFEGPLEQSSRTIFWTMSFTAKAWLFPPVRTSNLIREVNVDVWDFEDTEKKYFNVNVTPIVYDKDTNGDYILDTNGEKVVVVEGDMVDPNDDYEYKTIVTEDVNG
jgi:hypothetical protein